ncbi:Transposable element Tc3 transposase, partial [Dictyocoela muelleri]
TEISLNPCISLQTICDKLQIHNLSNSYSPSTAHRIIKRMDYSRKTLTLVPINRNSNANKDIRAQYATNMINIDDEKLIFLDETGFNLHSFQRMGYSPKNTKCFINVPNSKGTNVSVLCAITKEGVLGFRIKNCSFKSLDIKSFAETILPELSSNNRKFIIMDNTSIHKTSEVSEAFSRKNYILRFLPAYSPQLNPIEEFFYCLKSKVKQREWSINREMLINTIDDVLRNEVFIMERYFNNVHTWLEKAIARLDYI